MITVIITSFTDFHDYTTPLIHSIQERERGLGILVIDNGSKEPYPQGPGYRVHRFEEPVSWSKMLNTGASLSPEGWLVILNDDVKCTGHFSHFIRTLDPSLFYGSEKKVKPSSWFGTPVHYLKAWILVITRKLYFEIGGMDEWYTGAAVEDIDFCWTANQKGISFKVEKFSFRHLEDSRRKKWGDFEERAEKAKAYLKAKVEATL